jgi:hypothetical protein
LQLTEKAADSGALATPAPHQTTRMDCGRHRAARVAAGVQYLQPVVGIAAASDMFGDKLGGSFVAGVILVFVGLVFSMAGCNAEFGSRQ